MGKTGSSALYILIMIYTIKLIVDYESEYMSFT